MNFNIVNFIKFLSNYLKITLNYFLDIFKFLNIFIENIQKKFKINILNYNTMIYIYILIIYTLNIELVFEIKLIIVISTLLLIIYLFKLNLFFLNSNIKLNNQYIKLFILFNYFYKILKFTKLSNIFIIFKNNILIFINWLLVYYKSNILNNFFKNYLSNINSILWLPIYKVYSIYGFYVQSKSNFKNFKNENFKNIKY